MFESFTGNVVCGICSVIERSAGTKGAVMKQMLILAVASALAVVSGGALAQGAANATGEARLASVVDGRTAGTPTDCINLRDIASTQIIDRTAVIYHMRNGTIYVNRPSGAAFLDRGDILVTDTHSSRLCRVDIVRLVDGGSRMPSGTLGLGPFVPYPRSPLGNGR